MDQGFIRLLVFFSVLVLMASAEAMWPRKKRTLLRPNRWFSNVSLSVLNIIVIKLLGPITAITLASYAANHNIGLLNILGLPFLVNVVLGVILLDLAIYAQHVASHKIPLLWRFHKVHHADRDIDVTTGIRFHPIEALLSMLYKSLVVLVLGPLPFTVFLFEVILNASAMFNHANLRLPIKVDHIIRKLIVTPDFHRVHHSITEQETDNNYGFFLSSWDRLFKTYTAQPQSGHDDMRIGLNEFQTQSPANLFWSLRLPFK